MTPTTAGTKTVLFVTHGFPPMGGVGVQRVLKFVKYLPAFGWKPVVLTAEVNERDLAMADHALLNEIPSEVPVYRCRYLAPFAVYRGLGGCAKLGSAALSETTRTIGGLGRLAQVIRKLLVPDTNVFWLPAALRCARKIFSQHKTDVIVSSSPPETAHLIAARLSRLYHVAWVADFRDPWAEVPWNPTRPKPLVRLNASLERMTLCTADAVVVTSEETRALLTHKYDGGVFPNRKIELIYNGYDEIEFEGLAPQKFDRFTIVYAGRAVRPGCSPEPLLAAMRQLNKRHSDLTEALQVIFVGARSAEAERLVTQYRLKGMVRFTGYLPHRECLSYVSGADLLYLNTVPWAIPGKFSEYLRAHRPILAVMDPECETAQLVKELNAGTAVPPNDAGAVADAIEKYMRRKVAFRPKTDRIETFSRKVLTGQLARLLDSVAFSPDRTSVVKVTR